MSDPFVDLPKGHFGAILADPPWSFYNWSRRPWWERSDRNTSRAVERHYDTMSVRDIMRLPVEHLAADDCALFLWACWPSIQDAFKVLDAWGFEYKTCAFNWMKGHAGQIELFDEEIKPQMKMGYWTRASSEVCLLGTRGKPKRLNADVRQGIIAPVREHSRKPDGIHERIERLVGGPYLELFARSPHEGWAVWGNQTDKFAGQAA
jgi:N6-adenosine-specific RNA methylase IME4